MNDEINNNLAEMNYLECIKEELILTRLNLMKIRFILLVLMVERDLN